MASNGARGRVAVVFGGPSPEHDVSILTGLQALHELARGGHDALGIYWTTAGDFVSIPASSEAEEFTGGAPARAKPLTVRLGADGGFVETARVGRERRLDLSAVVVATHGGPGEDGTLQALLDLAGLPYSGPTVAGAALGMDKWSFGAAVAASGLPTLPRALLSADTPELSFAGPYIVKPRFGGSSIGIDVVADLATARARLTANPHLSRGAVIEPFRADLHDVQIAVRSYPRVALSAIERPVRRTAGAEILNYADKYVGGQGMVSAPRELPADVGEARRRDLEGAATAVAALASVRGVARLDFLCDDAEWFVNELNTIPGSLSKYLFIDPAVGFLALLESLLEEAVTRPAHQYSAAGADGLVLRSAGSIASKLA